MDDKSVRKLHGLYQVIEPLHDKQCERALVVVSQLHRKPPSKRAITGDASGSGAPQGELEWVVGLAGPGKPDPDAKGKKREPADEWWESRLSSDEIAEWLDEVRLPRSPAIGQLSLTRVGRTQADAPHQDPPALLAKLRLAWENGELHVKGYAGPGADPRMGLELEARIDSSTHLSLVLSPSSAPPFSLEQVLVETIPAFNRDKATLKSTDRPAALAPTVDYKEKYEKLLLRADKLASDKSRLESEVAVLREQTKRARKKAKRNDSGDGSLGTSGSPSPTKPAVPGETHRALLRPGDVGYAGNSARVGRISLDNVIDAIAAANPSLSEAIKAHWDALLASIDHSNAKELTQAVEKTETLIHQETRSQWWLVKQAVNQGLARLRIKGEHVIFLLVPSSAIRMPTARRSPGGEVEIPESPLPALIEEIAAAADVQAYIDQNWNHILRIINEATVEARRLAANYIHDRFIGSDDRLDNPNRPNRLHWLAVYYALLATEPPNYGAWLY
ncbi:hypothetical protein C6P46_002128 [Rhodotorula mucilaginosa]|uniref:Uncharacterized protein n=1 Tax=Rhodotorula mucilaginosa TaxID=5537 RepID=A0A9P6W508_RHOMI|nr:hypothetical protein C6P46_002128 [Rhodotorula mucilaginosa]